MEEKQIKTEFGDKAREIVESGAWIVYDILNSRGIREVGYIEYDSED